MKDRVTICEIIFGILVCAFTIFEVQIFSSQNRIIHDYYQVFLSGKYMGIIESDQELYDLIDKEQESIKKKYDVTKIYPPSGLEVLKIKTYDDEVLDARTVYEEIKDIDPFTIEGYEVTVKGDTNSKTLFVLKKDDLDEAVKNTILSFVDEEDYEAYLAGTQKDRKDSNLEIVDIYLQQKVSLKKTYISTEEEIFIDSDTLSLFFLFGTTELEKKYVVKSKDTLESIADKNKLGVEDLLVANPQIAGENALLAVGQELVVSSIAPVADVISEVYETEEQKISYDTRYELDKTLSASEIQVKQGGTNGISKVTYATKYMDGVALSTKMVNEEVVVAAQDRIIAVGADSSIYVGNSSYWAWPTSKPYRISSRYGYRYHPTLGGVKFHNGIDISGTKTRYIYAIQAGTVTRVTYNGSEGNVIAISHANGYTSTYMHLKTLKKKNSAGKKVSYTLVHKGDHVEKGQVIGIMGTTGRSTGVHLHLSIKKNGKSMNPLKLWQ